MLKKTIKFHDLDGKPLEEDFYFNFTKGELVELQFHGRDGLEAHLRRILATSDQGQIIKMFREIISKSVGRRGEDNRRFEKSEQISDEFMQTEAYSELLVELLGNANACAEFIKGVVPAEIAGRVDIDAAMKSGMKLEDFGPNLTGMGEIVSVTPVEDKPSGEFVVAAAPTREPTLREYTDQELTEMDYNKFIRLIQDEKGNVPQNAVVIAMNRMNEGK